KWMGKQLVVPVYATLLGQIALGLAVLILVLLVWLHSVRKAVHKRTQQLEEEQARLRTLVENSPDVIWMKDTAGRYLACNPLGLRLVGAEGDVVGKTDADLFPAEIAERIRASDQQALQAGGTLMFEENLVFPNTGQRHFFETLRTPVIKPGGEVTGIIGVARDVTVRRLHEQKIREQEALLKEMSSMARIGAWEFDLISGRATWTAEVARIHETNETDDRSIAHCLAYYHDESHDKVEQALRRCIAEQEPADIEVEMITALGNRKWVRAISRPVVENGKVVRVRGTMQDITERRHLEESMRMANLIYQTSFEAIAVTDRDNNVVDVNPAYLRQTGCTAEDVVGRTPGVFCSDMHDAAFYERMRNELALCDHWQGEIWDRAPDGALVARLVNIRVVRDPDGKVYRHIILFNDITEQKLKDELIWKQTNFDTLTGLPNRRLFVDRLEQEIKKCHGNNCSLGLMFFDLDRFKHINDTFGRARGDRALLEVTRRLRSRIPETATLSRLGGDSFALVISPLDKRLQLEMLAEALIEAIAAPLPIEGDHAYVTASLGIAVYPDDAADAEELLRHAEQAMHMAKHDGRARFSYFTRSAQREAQAKLMLTNDLRHALARHELELYYQPIVEMATGRIRKAEALLRWAHPVHGMISPARFIPLAEESGLILGIGEWVFEEAIASIQRWQRKFGNLVELSVNNSPVQFEQTGDCEWIERLSRSGLPPASLTVEITEGVLLKDSDQVRQCLKRLHENGTKVSIDDFGTGYSALSYLKHLDVDYLKIDKSFVANLAEDESDQALTGSIIDMAHKLGIQTIAEGVETPAQRDLLAAFGCDYVQGHLYSRAVPRDIFELILEPQGA
ncbi:MAG TPA: EAL domain-containing protein, partial [Telluria sp.]|nr:EAL domain-containing protein [Telluria sp.]